VARSPDIAQSSFLEAEKRFRDAALDYAPAVAFFAKAVEVTLRDRIFVPFADGVRSDQGGEHAGVLAIAGPGTKQGAAEGLALALFVAGRTHLELGAMHRALQLVSGETAKKVHWSAHFATLWSPTTGTGSGLRATRWTR